MLRQKINEAEAIKVYIAIASFRFNQIKEEMI